MSEFDFDFLRYLEPKLKLIFKTRLTSIKDEVESLVETFTNDINNKIQESDNILKEIVKELPKLTQKIKEIEDILEGDLSYKGFLKLTSKALANNRSNKMLIVEGLSECKNHLVKEKLNVWKAIFTSIISITQGYLQDKEANQLKSLGEYKKTLFPLKKTYYSANKEMNFLNCFEEVILYDAKNSDS